MDSFFLCTKAGEISGTTRFLAAKKCPQPERRKKNTRKEFLCRTFFCVFVVVVGQKSKKKALFDVRFF